MAGNLNQPVKEMPINFNEVPINIIFKTREGQIKEYILNTNNKHDKLMLNKKE
jgi:hypothetical protein